MNIKKRLHYLELPLIFRVFFQNSSRTFKITSVFVEDGAVEDGAAAVGVVHEGGAADQAPTAPRVTAQASLSSPLHSAYAVLLTLWRET